MEQEFLHGQIGVLSRQLQAANARAVALEAALDEAQRECDSLHKQVVALQSWIAAACNADHTLMPPVGVEINHRVAPAAHDWQDDSKEQKQ